MVKVRWAWVGTAPEVQIMWKPEHVISKLTREDTVKSKLINKYFEVKFG